MQRIKIDKHIIDFEIGNCGTVTVYIQYNNNELQTHCYYLIAIDKFMLLGDKLTTRQTQILRNRILKYLIKKGLIISYKHNNITYYQYKRPDGKTEQIGEKVNVKG